MDTTDPFEPVCIEWIDPRLTLNGWVAISEVNATVIHCTSIGYILSETEDVLCLGSTVSDAGQVTPQWVIPKVLITNRVSLSGRGDKNDGVMRTFVMAVQSTGSDGGANGGVGGAGGGAGGVISHVG